jgi:hypothetical protein
MKLKNQKPIDPNKQITYLPEDTADQAKLVQEASAIEPGPTEPIIEPAINEPPPMTDAEYQEVLNKEPISEAEAAAEILKAELAEANERNAEDNRDSPNAALDAVAEPFHVRFSEFCITQIRDTEARLKNLGLVVIAKTNELGDWLTTRGQDLYDWSMKQRLRLEEWHEARRPLRAAEFFVLLERIRLDDESEPRVKVAASTDNIVKELNAVKRQLAAMEKAVNKAVKSAGQVDPDLLGKYSLALIQGRKIQAANLYRELSGSDLAGAKLAIEALTPVSA